MLSSESHMVDLGLILETSRCSLMEPGLCTKPNRELAEHVLELRRR
jgi:hypothetical protein